MAESLVSIHNLHVVANVGFDVWGRRREQPLDISATLALSRPFSSAASTDTVDASTVHYGHLTKAIISATRATESTPWRSPLEFIEMVAFTVREAVADSSAIATIQIKTVFTKASRYGDGVGLLLCHRPKDDLTSVVLYLNGMNMSTLVGVNLNERAMKQKIVVSIAIDRINSRISDRYFELEQLIEKTAEESQFETLESLAEEMAARVIKYFLIPKHQFLLPEPAGVRVRIEKPSAVPFADAPSIEIYRSADAQDPFGKRMVSELGNKRPELPFPLEGRLDEFLQSWKQD